MEFSYLRQGDGRRPERRIPELEGDGRRPPVASTRAESRCRR